MTSILSHIQQLVDSNMYRLNPEPIDMDEVFQADPIDMFDTPPLTPFVTIAPHLSCPFGNICGIRQFYLRNHAWVLCPYCANHQHWSWIVDIGSINC